MDDVDESDDTPSPSQEEETLPSPKLVEFLHELAALGTHSHPCLSALEQDIARSYATTTDRDPQPYKQEHDDYDKLISPDSTPTVADTTSSDCDDDKSIHTPQDLDQKIQEHHFRHLSPPHRHRPHRRKLPLRTRCVLYILHEALGILYTLSTAYRIYTSLSVPVVRFYFTHHALMADIWTSLAGLVVLGVTLAAMSVLVKPGPLVRWIKLKNYQYEVTFGLYMLTPMEKFIFNSILFLLTSLLLIAGSLYLPEHLATVTHRVFYYLAGDETHTTILSQNQGMATGTAAGFATKAAAAVVEKATQTVGKTAGTVLDGSGAAWMEV